MPAPELEEMLILAAVLISVSALLLLPILELSDKGSFLALDRKNIALKSLKPSFPFPLRSHL